MTRAAVLLTFLLTAVSGCQLFAQTAQPQPAVSAAATAEPSAEAYYHLLLARLYEERLQEDGMRSNVEHAVEEYKAAIAADPGNSALRLYLAELEAHSGLMQDSVQQIKGVLEKEPRNIAAHRLLGHIYASLSGGAEGKQISTKMVQLATEQFEAVVKLGLAEFDDRLVLASLYHMAGNNDAALISYKEALKLQPDSEETIAQLADLYAGQNDLASALAVLEAVPEESRTPRLYFLLGSCYEQMHNSAKAIAAFRRLVELDPDNLDARRALAQSLATAGQDQEASTLVQSLIKSDPNDTDALNLQADLERRRGDFEAAVTSLRAAHNAIPTSVQIGYNLSLALESAGHFEEAEKLLAELLNHKISSEDKPESEDNTALFLERLALIYREDRKPQQALDSYRRLRELGAENLTRASLLTVECYREQREWTKALDAAQAAAAAAPSDQQLQLNLITQLADTAEPQKALDKLQALLKDSPKDLTLWLTLAQIQGHLGHAQEAETALAEALRLAPEGDSLSYAQFIAGTIYEHEKNFDRAEFYFQKVLSTDPNNASNLNYLGYLLAERGVRLSEARGYVEKALLLEPQNGAFLDSLGWIYYLQGASDKAEPYLVRAVALMPLEPELHSHLATLYAHTGRKKQAEQHWKRALELWEHGVISEADPGEEAKARDELAKTKGR